jgi:hypothetical protein
MFALITTHPHSRTIIAAYLAGEILPYSDEAEIFNASLAELALYEGASADADDDGWVDFPPEVPPYASELTFTWQRN